MPLKREIFNLITSARTAQCVVLLRHFQLEQLSNGFRFALGELPGVSEFPEEKSGAIFRQTFCVKIEFLP